MESSSASSPGIVVLTGDGRIGGSHAFHDWWIALIVVGLV
jgi:hypothetical protein